MVASDVAVVVRRARRGVLDTAADAVHARCSVVCVVGADGCQWEGMLVGRVDNARQQHSSQPASSNTHNSSSKKRFGGANGRAAKAAGFMRRAALQVDEGACDCEGCVQAGGKVKNPIRGKGRIMLVGALSAAAAGTTEHLPLF